jgi:hypothetical protein
MADTGEDREIRQRVEAKKAENIRESRKLAAKTMAAEERQEETKTLPESRRVRSHSNPKTL